MKRNITTTRITLGLVLGLALWNAEPNLQAGTKTVTNTSDSGAGSLRDTIANAASGDTINFSGCPCTITLAVASGPLLINKNLTIQGPGAQLLTVSGNNQSNVFSISTGATVTLDGLTIRDGNSSVINHGGGIYSLGTLTVTNSTVSNNYAFLHGAGIWSGGTLTVINSTVSNNSGAVGSGIFNHINSMLTVINSTVSHNLADEAGGIFNLGTLTVINSSVSHNSALYFGGIESRGTLTVVNGTVSNNSATDPGGGIFLGGGSSATVNNTIVAGNVGGGLPNDIFGTVTSGSHNLIGDTNSSGGLHDGTNGNIVGVDVNTVLEPLASNGGPTQTHKLVENGPAVNAGDNALAGELMTDQRGFFRYSGGTVDIGAFELQTYNFSGFLQPVANPPTVNSAKAGSAISVKFSLGGYQGLDIFKPGYPASQPMGCSNTTLNDLVQDPTATAGLSSLSYDPATDQYTYVWKTDRNWKNCRKLVIQFNNDAGSTAEAYFQFK